MSVRQETKLRMLVSKERTPSSCCRLNEVHCSCLCFIPILRSSKHCKVMGRERRLHAENQLCIKGPGAPEKTTCCGNTVLVSRRSGPAGFCSDEACYWTQPSLQWFQLELNPTNPPSPIGTLQFGDLNACYEHQHSTLCLFVCVRELDLWYLFHGLHRCVTYWSRCV